jgi:hypothetical protein
MRHANASVRLCVPLCYGRANGRPKADRLAIRSECTCDARTRIAYTSDAW